MQRMMRRRAVTAAVVSGVCQVGWLVAGWYPAVVASIVVYIVMAGGRAGLRALSASEALVAGGMAVVATVVAQARGDVLWGLALLAVAVVAAVAGVALTAAGPDLE